MGTRGTIGFRVDGKDMLTYNHFDSYPSWLLKHLLEEIKENKGVFMDVDALKKSVKKVKAKKQNKPATTEDIKKVQDWEKKSGMKVVDTDVSERDLADWYCLTRGLQGKIMPYLKGFPFMNLYNDFIIDSLFCEWGYIFNLDDKVLEVYRGFNKSPNGKGRYANLKDNDSDYYGCELAMEIPFTTMIELCDDEQAIDMVVNYLENDKGELPFGYNLKMVNGVKV